MVFTESKLKNIFYRLKHPQYVYSGKKYLRLFIISFIIFVILFFVSNLLAFISFIITAVLFFITLKKVNFFFRYNQKLEITNDTIIYTFDSGIGTNKEHFEDTFKIADLEGIEYFQQTHEIAFLIPVIYPETGFKAYGICAENVFSKDPLPYLKGIKDIKKIPSGSFSSKWRND